MTETVSIAQLMTDSRVPFGTSGARGLVSDMTDRVCAAYALAFVQHLEKTQGFDAGTPVAIGGDRRPSTPRILAALDAGLSARGYQVENHGLLPSPALALFGLSRACPTIMVTGSHIPADRNGMKFTTARGEIDKADEGGIRAETVELPDLFAADGSLRDAVTLAEPHTTSSREYVERYVRAFGPTFLAGVRLGVYGHSAVGRDLLVEIYEALGAAITRVGFSDAFIPVDTEAIRPEDSALARGWAKEHGFDALVSTDGDSDRPLLADENGIFLRGDVAGTLVASYFGADALALPVSCNQVAELSGCFEKVVRTRIGSPFVIAAMHELDRAGARRIVGYEANGGFLHLSPLDVPGGERLVPLPTRDPVIVHLGLLGLAKQKRLPISGLLGLLPPRVTASARDQSFSTDASRALLARLRSASLDELAQTFGLGAVVNIDETDGLRISFASGEVVHLRPSGNAPELRCYAEAEGQARAEWLVEHGLVTARREARAQA